MSETIDVPLAGVESIPEGGMRPFPAGAFEVLVCRVRGELYAVDNTCSHQEAKLCEGRLVGYRITCPKHSAQFDIRDGSHKNPPAYKAIATFELTVSDGAHYVRVPARKPAPNPGIGPWPMPRR